MNEVQSTSVSDGSILEGPLIINEICVWAKKKQKIRFLLFKVDFSKAFDSMNLGYLDSVMTQMGFRSRWRN